MMKKMFILICLVMGIQTASAVEFLVTDTSGNTLKTTGGGISLDLGHSPTSKTVQIWLTYTTTGTGVDNEMSTINAAGGLWGGSSKLVFGTPTAVRVYEPKANSILNARGWNQFASKIDYTSGLAQAIYNNGGLDGFTLEDSGKILVTEFVISPGESINSSGSLVTLSIVAGEEFLQYDGTSTTTYPALVSPQPGSYQFMVIPEPSTYAFCLVSTATLAVVGLKRRKKNTRQSAMANC